jgi:hypothetical protein
MEALVRLNMSHGRLEDHQLLKLPLLKQLRHRCHVQILEARHIHLLVISLGQADKHRVCPHQTNFNGEPVPSRDKTHNGIHRGARHHHLVVPGEYLMEARSHKVLHNLDRESLLLPRPRVSRDLHHHCLVQERTVQNNCRDHLSLDRTQEVFNVVFKWALKRQLLAAHDLVHEKAVTAHHEKSGVHPHMYRDKNRASQAIRLHRRPAHVTLLNGKGKNRYQNEFHREQAVPVLEVVPRQDLERIHREEGPNLNVPSRDRRHGQAVRDKAAHEENSEAPHVNEVVVTMRRKTNLMV